jgi:hypothetical protein
MEQLLARALREIADGALGDAILEMGIHAAEGELLLRVVASLLESVVLKTPVVAVVVEDLHAVFSGECFEGAFGGDGLLG